MKKTIRFMQGTGFMLFILGGLACDSDLKTCIIMVLAGLAIMLGFTALENQFYFEESEGRNEKNIKRVSYHDAAYPSYLRRG